MVETEIKLAVPGPRQARALLSSTGFQVTRPRTLEINLVLDDKKGSLRGSRRLLRLRKAGKIVTLTFKGPPLPGPHKSRPEYEVGLSSLEYAETIFGALGYRTVFRYEKYRTEYARPGESGHALLDHTPIGTFVELEGAAKWIDRTAHEFGRARKDYITLSYGSLYLSYCKQHGLPPTHMVFG
jgi:adenylate cyclase class 2